MYLKSIHFQPITFKIVIDLLVLRPDGTKIIHYGSRSHHPIVIIFEKYDLILCVRTTSKLWKLVIPLLGIYSKDINRCESKFVYKNIMWHIYIEKTWKESNCPKIGLNTICHTNIAKCSTTTLSCFRTIFLK